MSSGWELRSSGLLRSEYWQFLADVSGRPIGRIFDKKRKTLKMGRLGCHETSVSHYHCPLRNSSEERRSDIHGGGNLTSALRMSCSFKFFYNYFVCISVLIRKMYWLGVVYLIHIYAIPRNSFILVLR